MSEDPEIRTTVTDGVRVVATRGEFDLDTAETLLPALAPEGNGAVGTVVDLSQVDFADSAFLHSLLRALRDHESAGSAFVLAGPNTFVSRLLEVTDTARAFAIAPSVADAVADVRAMSRGDEVTR
ncbi:STAS domain-containing protein [Streptomyces sp. NPDC048182]|uniref:STAS domain-containing protein n=1 Tax=Streptomyces sp. NPDC048182 TaxID=3365507 RepID=UPI003713E050